MAWLQQLLEPAPEHGASSARIDGDAAADWPPRHAMNKLMYVSGIWLEGGQASERLTAAGLASIRSNEQPVGGLVARQYNLLEMWEKVVVSLLLIL